MNRMKPDALLPVETAKALVLANVRPVAGERVPIASALGRVLARDLKAKRDQPPFAASAMDGYAVRAADAGEAGVELRVVAIAPAGRPMRRRIGPGEAVRIFTGAPLPAGADAIAIQEDAEETGGKVRLREPAAAGRFVRPKGLDFRRGEALLVAPRRLGPRDLGLAAAAGHGQLMVRRRPLVAILATGDELVAPGARPRPGQIVASNGLALAGLVALWGGTAVDLGIAADDVRAIRSAIARAADADVLLTTGGASVGEHDLVRQALAAERFRLGFWKIAMRPGKPLLFATRGRRRVLGLPGNPVSAVVCARVFLKPLISALLGLPVEETLIDARLATALEGNDGRQDYLRTRLETAADGTITAMPFPLQDSSMQRIMALADGLIVRPPHDRPRAAGSTVKVLRLDF